MKFLSLGCIPDLTDYADNMIPLLASYHSTNLEVLHIASVKENPDSYGLIQFPQNDMQRFQKLKVLGLDYDYLTNQLLQVFMNPCHGKLEKLIIHVHGIDSANEKISNVTWREVVANNPGLEVTLNLLHSEEGAEELVDLVQPCMPLAHLRMFFCGIVNEAALTFIAQHCNRKLKSIHIMDGMPGLETFNYRGDEDEDPFVMLAWKCPNLSHFTLYGYYIESEDVIAMARLRGSQLQTFDIPACAITYYEVDEEYEETDLFEEVSASLGRPWNATPDNAIPAAITNPDADVVGLYLPYLIQDQRT